MNSLTTRIAVVVALVAGGLGLLSSPHVLAAHPRGHVAVHSRDDGDPFAQQSCGNAGGTIVRTGWQQVTTVNVGEGGDHGDAMPGAQPRLVKPHDGDTVNVFTNFNINASSTASLQAGFTVDGAGPVQATGELGGPSSGLTYRATQVTMQVAKEGVHSITAWVHVNSSNQFASGQIGNFCLTTRAAED
jgi:hypothetical protein